jgi:Ricin-type beta-trefoil lectin domain-like
MQMSKALKVAGILSGAAITGVATAVPAGASTTITWKSASYGKYLEIYQAGKNNGNWAHIYAWHNGSNQKWTAINEGYDSRGNTEWVFVNQNSGKCLEDYAYEKSGHVDQWSCGSYGSNARWQEIYNPFGNSPPGDSYELANYGNNEWACPESNNWVMWGGNLSYCIWE